MDGRPILDLNAFDARSAGAFTGVFGERLTQRAAVLGDAAMLFYDKPLEVVRGEGCWLYDAAGVAYLDAYNNVPSVGHCHPHVVEAVSRQLAQLNIHSRYLHPGVIDYARRLTATLPTGLSQVVFTCTGSESNDLALRMAQQFTGASGIIVTESAYHGNTALVTQVSPTLSKAGGVAAFVRRVPAPDARTVVDSRGVADTPDMRGMDGARAASDARGLEAARSLLDTRGVDDARAVSDPQASSGGAVGERFAAQVSAAIADLERCGVGCAALLVDSIFSSDGVFADPPGFLRAAVEAVRRAGGLLIADEVQCGFGRTGAALWGFERHAVIPDVVTFGKPMGNGYPIGAVALRPPLLEAFMAKFGYFNTFGGSPVAAAAGQAVLDVIEREGLMQNAASTGDHLKRGLLQLQARHAAVGDVRGAGLYVGVELNEEGRPAPALANVVINGMRERQVLIGAAGKFGNVLKIRPPLSFSSDHAERLISVLDQVLTETARSSRTLRGHGG